jgi:hypothetical protein
MSVSSELYAVGAATAMLEKKKKQGTRKGHRDNNEIGKMQLSGYKKNDYFGNLVKFFNIALQRFAHQRFFSFPT